MAYLALYRKYRPLTFGEVVGQEFVTSALRHAVEADRLAHAYLFSGPRGTGKTSTARIFARAINCLQPSAGEPCNVCGNCKSIMAGQWGLVEIDGASHNRVEDMRSLLDSVYHVPMAGRYNVYIIDEVHMLSNAAFNAFLKTLEEPPAHVKFILATTEPFKIPRTVHSRCQHYVFQSVPTAEIAEHVNRVSASEGIVIDELSARLIAEAGNGSLRDALSVLDRVVAYCADGVTAEAVQALLGLGDIGTVMDLVAAAGAPSEPDFLIALERMVVQGHDLAEVTKSLLQYGRVLLFLAAGVSDPAILGLPLTDEQRAIAEQTAKDIGRERLYRFIEITADLAQQLRFDLDKRLGFELGMLELRNAMQGATLTPVAAAATRLASPEAQRAAPSPPPQTDRPVTPPRPPVPQAPAATRPAPAPPAPGNDPAASMLDAWEQAKAKKGQVHPDVPRSAAPPKDPPRSASTPPPPNPSSADGWDLPGDSDQAPKSKAVATDPNDGDMTIGAEVPRFLKLFLEECRQTHPAWIPLLQGLKLIPIGDHAYELDIENSLAMALAWWRDQRQRKAVYAHYHALIGQTLSIERMGGKAEADAAAIAGAEQGTLAGIPAPPVADDWKAGTAETLKGFFPDMRLQEG